MVIQVNIWKCEICGRIATTSEETSPYSDPVVVPPNGEDWGYYVVVDGKELLSCPECKAKAEMPVVKSLSGR